LGWREGATTLNSVEQLPQFPAISLRHKIARRLGIEEYIEARLRTIVSRHDEAITETRRDIQSLLGSLGQHMDEANSNASREAQILLALTFQDRRDRGGPLPSLQDVEFRVHSQNGEDGILLYLFSLLGSPTKKAVEICAGSGKECNAANLIINHGWRALLVDGDTANIAEGEEFYERGQNTFWFPPYLVQRWVTTDNVNDLVQAYGFEGEIDLFSLDLDGIDYWIWQALDSIQPRVVVAEFNWTWGPDEAKTVPYDPGFAVPPIAARSSAEHVYFGASLSALVKLAREKGYRLVGCQQFGFNAFFVRDGIGEEWLPEVSAAACFDTAVMRMRWSPEFVEQHESSRWVSV
jgi:hypothetical protein